MNFKKATEWVKAKGKALFDQKFADRVWGEGELSISAKEVGGKLELVNPDDKSVAPAPDGDYNYEGAVYTVMDGFITAIDGKADAPKEEEAPAEEVKAADEEAPAEEAPADDSKNADTRITELEAVVQAMAAVLEDMKAKLDGTASQADVADFSVKLSAIDEKVIKVLKTPAQFSQTSTNPVVKDAKDKQLTYLANIMKK